MLPQAEGDIGWTGDRAMERTPVAEPAGDDRCILRMERCCRRRDRCGAMARACRERAPLRVARCRGVRRLPVRTAHGRARRRCRAFGGVAVARFLGGFVALRGSLPRGDVLW